MAKKKSRLQRCDKLQATLRLISGDDDLDALPNVDLVNKKLSEGERREVVLDRDSPLGGRIHTNDLYDLNDVKQLVGVEDRLGAKKVRYPNRQRARARKYTPDELLRAYKEGVFTPDMNRFVREVGRQYVFGDSRDVRGFKAIIETVYMRGAGRFDLTSACFGTIRVFNGWSLVLTSSIQLFCANRLLLEPLARVRRTSNADISFNVSEIRVVQPELPI